MFERLTIKTDICIEPENEIVYHNPNDPEGMYNILDLAECLYSGGKAEAGILMEISKRLAAYEDSQMTPEEVQTLAKAKADGRLVVLPCKIGDEVWFLEKQLDIANGTCSTVISEYIVTEIRGNKYNPLWYMASSERCTHRDFHPTELGKTVFLTREEAEKALEVW